MKNTFTLVMLIVLTGCIRSANNQLQGRWDFGYTNMPSFDSTMQEISEANGEELPTTYQKFFLDNKLVLRKDNSFDLVLFRNYLHGNWAYTDSSKQLRFSGMAATKDFSCRVDSAKPFLLQLRFDSIAIHSIVTIQDTGEAYRSFTQNAEYVLRLYPDELRYSSQDIDPYSKTNNNWPIKPKHAETDAELKARVNNHLQFWKLLFTDAISKDKSYIAYNWFASPLVVAANGVALGKYDKVKAGWNSYFYDTIQAKQSYALMQKSFSKEIKIPNGDSRYRNDIDMINQLISNLDNPQ